MTNLPTMGVQWELDGIQFNAGPDADGNAYVVQRSRGWVDGAPPRPELIERPSANGSYRNPNYRGSRIVELEGIAQCASRDGRDALGDTLAGLCTDPSTVYTLIRTERTRELSLGVELNARVSIEELPDGFTLGFNIQVVATDPRKYSTLVKTAGPTAIAQAPTDGAYWSGPAGTTGAEWNGPAVPNTGMVWQASSGISGNLAMTNDGRAETPILFTITAPSSGTLVQPTITDTGRSLVIAYGGTMSPGDVMTIDTRTNRVLLNGVPVSALFTRFDTITIPARTTINVQFSAVGSANNASLLAQWADAY